MDEGCKNRRLATLLVRDARRFHCDPLPSAVDTLIGTRQPVAHTAALIAGPNPLVLRIRSGSGAVGHTGADLGKERRADVLVEIGFRGSPVA